MISPVHSDFRNSLTRPAFFLTTDHDHCYLISITSVAAAADLSACSITFSAIE